MIANYSNTPPSQWGRSCIAHLPASLPSGLVDAQGRHVPTLDNNTWGIDIRTCYQYCDMKSIPFAFEFADFSAAFTNYLLPWLALTAQLPYETSSPWSNIMSFCLAVGSPALITYSLTLTILNRLWIHQHFNGLLTKCQHPKVIERYDGYVERVRAAQYLLQESQQVPLRASQERGWLSSLIVSVENQSWWLRVRDSLANSRRGVTFSLVAQILAAVVAWLFTIISAFISSLGDTAVANDISSGSLWAWLWRHDSIERALEADPAHRALEPPLQEGSEGVRFTDKGTQKGIKARSGLTLQLDLHQTNPAGFSVPKIENLSLQSWAGADISGDERRAGPIYNYARVFTWWQFANSIHKAFDTTIQNIESEKACLTQQQLSEQHENRQQPNQSQPNQQPPQLQRARYHVKWGTGKPAKFNLEGNSRDTASYCGLDTPSILAYPEWSQTTPAVWKRIFAASIFALIVQWGTSGASILIAFLTPTVGLGCRSGSYLLYGVFGTLAWLFLLASMLLSHASMLHYQEEHVKNSSIDFRYHPPGPTTKRHQRTRTLSVLCGLAVITRLIGKSLVVVNALWLVLTSLLEYIGVYNTCWCEGNAPGMGDGGWVTLFRNAEDLRDAAKSSWAGGVALSMIVCSVALVFFWLGSPGSGKK